MDAFINYLQLGANAFSLLVAGWIYLAYIQNLNSTIHSKDEQIKTVEKNLIFLKDKISDLEKRSPENIEKILNDRIKIREEEINRLSEDRQSHTEALAIKIQEIKRLKSDIEKSKDIRKTMELLELDMSEVDEEYRIFSLDAKYEIEEMGYVAVDSGQLMITDPVYIETEWKNTEFEDIRLVKDIKTGEIYQFNKDFSRYTDTIDGYTENVNELIASGKFENVNIDLSKKIDFSYAGACYATLSDRGYGALPFSLGHEGAGIVVSTVMGDGIYPVYAEKYDGRIVRVYFNLL